MDENNSWEDFENWGNIEDPDYYGRDFWGRKVPYYNDWKELLYWKKEYILFCIRQFLTYSFIPFIKSFFQK